jgi:hypothetical protein
VTVADRPTATLQMAGILLALTLYWRRRWLILHRLYAITHVPKRQSSTARMIMAWPIRVSTAYLELLEQQRPEALIILAYYTVPLHFYSPSWIIGDSGQRLLVAIEQRLGSYWTAWLDWPKEIVSTQL